MLFSFFKKQEMNIIPNSLHFMISELKPAQRRQNQKSFKRNMRKYIIFTLLLLSIVSLATFISRRYLPYNQHQSASRSLSSLRLLQYDDPTMLCFLGQDKPFVQTMKFQIAKDQILVNTRYPPIVMVTDATDGAVSSIIADQGTWQPANIKTFSRFIKKGDNILNIGAHIGLEGIVLAKKYAQGKGKLYFFEPYQVSKRILEKNVYINGLEQVTTVYKIAASNQKGRAKMRIIPSNTGMTFMVKQQRNKTLTIDIREQLTEMNTVDNVLPSDAVIDFALIDTEMSEIEVLEGMKNTIIRSPNLIIVVQWAGYSRYPFDEQFNIRRDALISWFSQQKYHFYKIDRPYQGNATPKGCEKQVFLKMSDKQLIDLGTRMKANGMNTDILIIPGHIDPNTLQ